MNRKLHSLMGLKWNPFLPEVETAALFLDPALEHFRSRIQAMAARGGFALITGDPGSGKSVALRILARALEEIPAVLVGILTRPHCSVYDFYREIGELFCLQVSPSNRYSGAKVLRKRWLDHIERTGVRAILVVDEAQEVKSDVLNEIRHLSSWSLDSKQLLTVILAGDDRFLQRLRHPDLVPLGSRIRCRLLLAPREPEELRILMLHMLREAGNEHLLATPVLDALCEHAGGNLRILMNMGAELLEAGMAAEAGQIDESLYFATFKDMKSPRPVARRKR